MLNFKGMRFPIDVILVCIRWYLAYPLSYRHLGEMMKERGVSVDHSSINRWAIRFLPLIEKVSRKHKRLVGGNWRMDETYIKVKGVWKYLYRAVDKDGKTVDFLLTAQRHMAAARRFFDKPRRTNGDPERSRWTKAASRGAAAVDLPAARQRTAAAGRLRASGLRRP
jgi:putative transposase